MTDLEKSVNKESHKVFDERQAKMIREILQMCPKPTYKLALPLDLWRLTLEKRRKEMYRSWDFDPEMFKFE